MFYKTNNAEKVIVLHVYLLVSASLLLLMIKNAILVLILLVIVVFSSAFIISRFQRIEIHNTYLLKRRPVLKKTAVVANDNIVFQKAGTASTYIMVGNEVIIMEYKKEIGRIKFETARSLEEFRKKTDELGYRWLKDR